MNRKYLMSRTRGKSLKNEENLSDLWSSGKCFKISWLQHKKYRSRGEEQDAGVGGDLYIIGSQEFS